MVSENLSVCPRFFHVQPGQLTHAGLLYRERATPDQEEQGLSTPATHGMPDDIAGPFGCRKGSLGAAQHEVIGSSAKRLVRANWLALGYLN